MSKAGFNVEVAFESPVSNQENDLRGFVSKSTQSFFKLVLDSPNLFLVFIIVILEANPLDSVLSVERDVVL